MIRYRLSSGEDSLECKAYYTLNQIEKGVPLLKECSPEVEIISRDYGTGKYLKGKELFEGDAVLLSSGERGVIKRVPGGFEVCNKPLTEVKISKLLN
ncbi:MAG: hypothetical protein ACOCTT_03885 [archaeon]